MVAFTPSAERTPAAALIPSRFMTQVPTGGPKRPPCLPHAITWQPQWVQTISSTLSVATAAPECRGSLQPATNKWTTVAPIPTARYGLAAVTGPDGRIYAIGGNWVQVGPEIPVEAYDTKSDTWTTVAKHATARVYLAAATGADGRIYAIGGFQEGNGKRLNTVEAYDTKTNNWTTVAAMPTALMRLQLQLAPMAAFTPLADIPKEEFSTPRKPTIRAPINGLLSQTCLPGVVSCQPRQVVMADLRHRRRRQRALPEYRGG